MNKGVSIIILTWNGLDYTKLCLDSVINKTRHPNFEIIVLDNGSTDGTVEYLKSIENITLVQNKENEGFVQGNNKAIKFASKGNDIIFLNNDIIIQQEDWITLLQETAYSDEKIGVVGCRLVGIKGDFQHAGTYIYSETCWGQQIGGNEDDINQHSQINEVQGVIFACAYIKRNIIDLLDGLDSDYFAYFEDTDFCLRVREFGYKVLVDGRVTNIHFHNTSTKINKVNFSDMFNESQVIFKKKWKKKLENRYNSSIAWNSLVNFPSGYAVSSKNLILAMDNLNVDVRYKYVYGPGTPWPVIEPEASDDYRINVIRSRKFDENLIQVVYGQGDVFYRNTGKYKIGFTMLEVDGLPKEWVQQANQMDEVWVPSEFSSTVFKNSGVKSPIHVVPLGVDPNYFNPQIKGFRKNIEQYVFLSVFEWGERKAPEKLLKAFNNEFKNNEDAILICKVFNNDSSIDVKEEIKKLNLKTSSKIIFIYNQEIPSYQMGSLYRSADCLVLPTRGEGWGMPILEAMASGLPVIATDWSAHKDFFNEDNGYPVRVKNLIPAEAKCPYYEGFRWADPDIEDLQYKMRYVFENRLEAKQKGLDASDYVLNNWTWEHAALKIKNRLLNIN